MENTIIRGRYQIEMLLGQGGYGAVYRATDLIINRVVALKTIHIGEGGPSPARVEREAKLYSRVTHPAVQQLYDVFFDKGQFYFVFPYIEGRSLDQVIHIGQITLRRVVRYAIDIMDGLAHIHDHNIIHRDLKPSNILLSSTDDHAIITDFGISKAIDIENLPSFTPSKSMLGTPAYMPPEVMKYSAASPASDIYSAGVVIYEMLTGYHPHEISTFATLIEQVLEVAPTPIERFRPATPKPLSDLVQRMLSKDPNLRPTAQEALEQLQEIANQDWDAVEKADIEFTSTQTTQVKLEKASELFDTRIPEDEPSAPKGFFANEAARYQEFVQSTEFYRWHLDNDYKTLLGQAKLAFWLWFLCALAGFAILAIGIILLYQGNTIPGSITLVSEAIILFIQRVFKHREEYYRQQAEAKNKHLEAGNLWSLALQSVDGLGDPALRLNKLSQIIDALTSRLKSTDYTQE